MSILMCYDGSPSAAHALSVAQETLEHKHAILLHVWNPPAQFLADAFSAKNGDAGPTYADLEALALHRARKVAEQGRELAAGLGLDVEVREERNDSSVWQTILHAAEAVDSERPVVVVPPGKSAHQ